MSIVGSFVIIGTRLSIEFILELFSEGWTEQQILESYPTLTTDALQAVFAFAAERSLNSELPDAHLAVERGLLPSTTTASTVVDLSPYCFGLT
jgi:uncharacterized protein (DUF433 family)